LSRKNVEVQVSLREIYRAVCPKCKKKIRELIREKITEDMVNRVLEGSS